MVMMTANAMDMQQKNCGDELINHLKFSLGEEGMYVLQLLY